jgi:hypothetical protein
MNTDQPRVLSTFGALFAIIVLYFPLTWWRAWVATTLWDWFVLPVYEVVAPPLWNVAGMFLIVGLVTMRMTNEKHDPWESMLLSAMAPAMILFFGWITTFML